MEDRKVWFPKQGVIVDMQESPSGITRYSYTGMVPPRVERLDPVVVHLDEFTTRWMGVDSTANDHLTGRMIARVSLIRDRREVESFQAEVAAVLLSFADAEFPSSDYLREVEQELPPGRDVIVTLEGPPKTFSGASGKLTPKQASKILGGLRATKDYKHPYVNAIKIKTLTDEGKGACQYVIQASII